MQCRLRPLLIVLAVGPPLIAFICVGWIDPEAAAEGAFVAGLFASVALLTRFFSSRPRLLIRCFVPREEYRQVSRSILRNSDFEPSMRWMSNLQLTVALWVGASLACFVE
jgi:hypothetical protein